MTKKDLTDIALKIVGLYMLTISISSMVDTFKSLSFYMYGDTENVNENLIYLIINIFKTGLYAFGFWLLTLKTARITGKLVKVDSNAATFTINKAELLHVLFCAAGIIVLFFSISDFWTTLILTSSWDYDFLPEGKRAMYFMLMLAVPLTKVIFGLILIFFSQKLTRRLTKRAGK